MSAITQEQIDYLNRMNSIAYKVQLGTLLQALESAAIASLADGKIFVGDATNTAVGVTPSGDVTSTNAGVFAIGAGRVLESMIAGKDSLALGIKRIAYGLFDPSAVAGSRTIAPHNCSVDIPAKAIITRAGYQVKTTLTSATDAGTVAFSVEGAGDLKAAIAISDVANPWDAGFGDLIPDGTAAHFVQCSVARKIVATVAVEALTAGKILVWAEYVQGL